MARKNGNKCGIQVFVWLEVYFIITLSIGFFLVNILWIRCCNARLILPYVIFSYYLVVTAAAAWVIYGYVIYFSDDNDC